MGKVGGEGEFDEKLTSPAGKAEHVRGSHVRYVLSCLRQEDYRTLPAYGVGTIWYLGRYLT